MENNTSLQLIKSLDRAVKKAMAREAVRLGKINAKRSDDPKTPQTPTKFVVMKWMKDQETYKITLSDNAPRHYWLYRNENFLITTPRRKAKAIHRTDIYQNASERKKQKSKIIGGGNDRADSPKGYLYGFWALRAANKVNTDKNFIDDIEFKMLNKIIDPFVADIVSQMDKYLE